MHDMKTQKLDITSLSLSQMEFITWIQSPSRMIDGHTNHQKRTTNCWQICDGSLIICDVLWFSWHSIANLVKESSLVANMSLILRRRHNLLVRRCYCPDRVYASQNLWFCNEILIRQRFSTDLQHVISCWVHYQKFSDGNLCHYVATSCWEICDVSPLICDGYDLVGILSLIW